MVVVHPRETEAPNDNTHCVLVRHRMPDGLADALEHQSARYASRLAAAHFEATWVPARGSSRGRAVLLIVGQQS